MLVVWKGVRSSARGLPPCAVSSNLITGEHWDHDSDGGDDDGGVIGECEKALKARICVCI